MDTSWGEIAAIYPVAGGENIGGATEWRVIAQKDKNIVNIHLGGYWLFEAPPSVGKVKFYQVQSDHLELIWDEIVEIIWPSDAIADGALHNGFFEMRLAGEQ